MPRVVTMGRWQREWWVWLSGASHAHWRPLNATLEGLLAKLEAAGLTFQRVATVETLKAHPDPSVKKLLEFGVVELCSAPAQPGQGVARQYPEGIKGPLDRSWPLFLDWISETLASPKLANKRDKLMRTRAWYRLRAGGPSWMPLGETGGWPRPKTGGRRLWSGFATPSKGLPRFSLHLGGQSLEGGGWSPARGTPATSSASLLIPGSNV